nr:vitamin B12-dependent ribonucleotide reductase [Micromonospora sp. DSM 115978]
VVHGGTVELTARLDGRVVETLPARELFTSIAKAAWDCADPGLHYGTTISAWHTTPSAGPISASNSCSEFLFLDNTSCAIASLNLLRFLRPDGSFDAGAYTAAVEIVVVATDISYCFAAFPTAEIGRRTRAYRPLGIGYANLGALLMATGRAYDSPAGRSLAAAVTSLTTAPAYRRSAELAAVVGAYDGFDRDAVA